MSKGKGQYVEPSQGTRKVHRRFEQMDIIMLNEFVEQEHEGNRHDGNWSPEAYGHVENPHASRRRTLQIRNYDIMKDLFDADRATGQNAWSGRQILHSLLREKETIDLNDACGDACGDTSMHGQDGPVGDETQSAPNVDSFSPANVQSNQPMGTPGSRGTKRKAPMVDLVEAQMERLSTGLGLVTDALKTGLKMVGSRSKRLRNGKAKKVVARTIGKPSSKSKKNNMEGRSTLQLSKNGKLKNSVNDPTLLQSLDYSRFFSKDNQVESYLEGFLARYLVKPRLMNLDFFHSNGFEFQNLIKYQGLKHFVSIECNYLVELVKVFYYNMTIANEDLLSEVKNVKIRVRASDWLAIAGLKYEGEKFATTKIRSWENYNRIEAVREEDIFVLWAIKERTLLNWSFYICQHMKKVKDKYMMSLPYAMLVTKILYHYGVDSNLEGLVAPNDEVEEAAAAPAEPGSLPQGNDGGEQPSHSIPMEDMIKYIYSTLHNIEHSLDNLSNYVGELNSKLVKKF
ncbi:hypothetical protein SESBI_01193 [Sesbania bispinosa]|nr:hypothetical protein SESBI_01193 [Sesbania bispinosa]